MELWNKKLGIKITYLNYMNAYDCIGLTVQSNNLFVMTVN